jgi:hypothetical protein
VVSEKLTFAIDVIEWPQISQEAAVATNKTPIKVELTSDERQVLEQVARSLAMPHRDVVRAQTILLLAEGRSVSAVGRQVGRARRIVCKWAGRFNRKRLRGLDDAPRSGRPPRFSPDRRNAPGEARV